MQKDEKLNVIIVYDNQNKRTRTKSIKHLLHRLVDTEILKSSYNGEQFLAYSYDTGRLLGLQSLDGYIVRYVANENMFVKAIKCLQLDKVESTGIVLTARQISQIKSDNAEIQV